MVVFTCNNCGDSVQKPKVEKHFESVCRRPKNLTCVDCLKDFRGEEYAVHTSCLTEDQRYSAKGTEVKPQKGLQKQDTWVGIVQACYNTEPGCKNPKLQTVFKAILGQSNIPRKKAKFLNYISSSMGNRINKDDAGEVFDLIQKYVKQQEVKKAAEKSKKIEENDENVDETVETVKEVKGQNQKKSEKRKSEQIEGDEIKTSETVEESDAKVSGKQQISQAGKSKKRKNETSDIVAPEELKKSKTENDEDSINKATVNSESDAPTKKKNKKRNKNKIKQQNDNTQKQNGAVSSKEDKLEASVVKKNKNKVNGLSNIQNGVGSLNNELQTSVVKKLKNKGNANGLSNIATTQNGVSSKQGKADGNDGEATNSKKRRDRRHKNQDKALKKINATKIIEENQTEEKVAPEKAKKKKNKKNKNKNAATVAAV